MRVHKMITKGECFDLLSNSLNSFRKEMYRDQFGEFVCGYRGLKGYTLLCSTWIFFFIISEKPQ